MTYLEAIFLGFIQALTEFLPISSSGHLVLFQKLLGIKSTDMMLEIILHLGTLFSIIIFFWNDIKEIVKKSIFQKDRSNQIFIFKIIVATIPASIFGILFKDNLVQIFDSLFYVCFWRSFRCFAIALHANGYDNSSSNNYFSNCNVFISRNL